MRYVWSAFLLIAALLAPSVATAIILLFGGLLTLVLTFVREQKVSQLTSELSDLLSVKRKNSSVALERSLAKIQRNALLMTIVSELIVFVCLLGGVLDITVARNYALLILVALSPLGLELTLFWLLHSKQKRGSETVRTVIRYATEDARILLTIIGLSLIGTVWLHIPSALSPLQMLFITVIVRPMLSGKALQSLPNKLDRTWRAGLTAVITYGSFVFYFIRHHLEPRYADSLNPLVGEASTVAFSTFIICQTILLFLETRRPPRLRLLMLLTIIIAIVYISGLQTLFKTQSIGFDDWTWVFMGGASFGALSLLWQRYTLKA